MCNFLSFCHFGSIKKSVFDNLAVLKNPGLIEISGGYKGVWQVDEKTEQKDTQKQVDEKWQNDEKSQCLLKLTAVSAIGKM